MTPDQNDLEYLRKHYPYLFDVEMQVRRVIDATGYGDVSVVLTIQHGVVERAEIMGAAKKLYYRRVENKLERLEIPIDIDR
jgi:hypothetical protein